MDCDDIRLAFSDGPIVRSPQLEQHVRECRECAELFREEQALGRALGAANAPESFELSTACAATELALERERGLRATLRSQSTNRRLAVVFGLLLLMAVHELLGHHPTAAVYRVGTLPAILLCVVQVVLVAPLLLRAFSTTLALSPALLTLAGLGLPFLVALLLPTLAQGETLRDAATPASTRCFSYGSAIALPMAFALWLFDRRDRHGFGFFALLATVLGSSANLLLFLHCPSVEPLHLFVGHASIGVAWLLAIAATRELHARARAGPAGPDRSKNANGM
jgi:hypothetical protein